VRPLMVVLLGAAVVLFPARAGAVTVLGALLFALPGRRRKGRHAA